MRRVLFDSDVLLDVLAQRQPFAIASTQALNTATQPQIQLIEAAAGGEEVIIRSDGISFRIVPISPVTSTAKFGSAKGLVKMPDDFDEPLEDFEDYAP